ncbi:MAG: methyltransferase [Clostridium sp.]|nr:methyltransferase [Prevotella sp.]MCM1428838.1 methyltransferase [Clostridium sp.]MCM1475213.1 methyltransferase [Muribaculaceae bacterium]
MTTDIDKNRFFFKEFSVAHSRSSMKVGVDGVLVGMWAEADFPRYILDVGTGCGVIALMAAQRFQDAMIDAVDIDGESIEEALQNFDNSPWASRLNAIQCDYKEFATNSIRKYDLIISNPPYFDSGVSEVSSRRIAARHQQSLPINQLLENSYLLLSEHGRISIVIPSEILKNTLLAAKECGLFVARVTRVRGHSSSPYKRVLVELRNEAPPGIQESELTLEKSRGVPTREYQRLGCPFYLKF